MNTSYFAKYKGENGVSIAGKTPDWYKGREYKKLAPKFHFFKDYKKCIKYIDELLQEKRITIPEAIEMKRKTEENYTIHYYSEVLNVLDPHQVYGELGENAVLLCWEKSGEFCHRRLVAEWLKKELGIEVKEL